MFHTVDGTDVDHPFFPQLPSYPPDRNSISTLNSPPPYHSCFYWGTSSWSAEQITEATEVANRLGLIAPIADQSRYSMLHREPLEKNLLPVFDRYK